MIITDDLGGVWRILENLGEARRVSKGGGGVNALWQSP